jgi:uncharacterized membrane protein YgaE (UPF0421/DUF939 family)
MTSQTPSLDPPPSTNPLPDRNPRPSTSPLPTATLLRSGRTTTAALVSLLLARLLKLPEFYWAPVSAIVIIESTVDARIISWQRFAGTALGAAIGAIVGTFFVSDAGTFSAPNVVIYAISVFVCGALCAALRIHGASRFASITVSIILLVAHTRAAWIVAWHRFAEVSLGIAVGLVLDMVWPMKIEA